MLTHVQGAACLPAFVAAHTSDERRSWTLGSAKRVFKWSAPKVQFSAWVMRRFVEGGPPRMSMRYTTIHDHQGRAVG